MKTTPISTLQTNRDILVALIQRHGDAPDLVVAAAELLAADARLTDCVKACKCGEDRLAGENPLDVIWAYDDALEAIQHAVGQFEADPAAGQAGLVRALQRLTQRFVQWMHPAQAEAAAPAATPGERPVLRQVG